MTYKGINFNGDSGTAERCRYWCNFNANNWWLADRLLLLVYVPSPSEQYDGICLQVYNTGIGTYTQYPDIIVYQPDSNKYAIIDLTEIARTYAPNSHGIYLWYGNVGQEPSQEDIGYILTTAAKGLINPAGVVIPSQTLRAYGAAIVPPSRMIGAFNLYDIANMDFLPLKFEFWKTTGTWDMTEYVPQALNPVTIQNGSIQLDDWGTEKINLSLYNGGGEAQQTYTLSPMECGKTYAQVRWVSFTGVERIHIFEVVKNTQTTKNAYSLMNLAGEYTEVKGREDSFKLYIDGLNAYDLWYYADILQSSKVEVCLGNFVFRQVQVTSSEVTIPDGDAIDGKLEINVNWHEYDAVAL